MTTNYTFPEKTIEQLDALVSRGIIKDHTEGIIRAVDAFIQAEEEKKLDELFERAECPKCGFIGKKGSNYCEMCSTPVSRKGQELRDKEILRKLIMILKENDLS
jgi:F0F1-type ATP synthase gamma subunit